MNLTISFSPETLAAIEQLVALSKGTPEPTATGPSISFEEVKDKALPLSKAGYKDILKAKLTELGAKALADLSPDKYETFMNFLNTL